MYRQLSPPARGMSRWYKVVSRIAVTLALKASLSFVIHFSFSAFPCPTFALSLPTTPWSTHQPRSVLLPDGLAYWQVPNLQAFHSVPHRLEYLSLMASTGSNSMSFFCQDSLLPVNLFVTYQLTRP